MTMNKRPEIEKKAEEMLNSLGRIQRATPAPFFYTRLKARLDRKEKNAWEATGRFFVRPVVAIAALCLILLINGLIFFRQEQQDTTARLADQNEQTLASEYGLATNNIYFDNESNEP
jgi:hypothetical protein